MNPTHFLLHLSVVTYLISSLLYNFDRHKTALVSYLSLTKNDMKNLLHHLLLFVLGILQIVLLFEWLRNKFNILHLQITNLHADAGI